MNCKKNTDRPQPRRRCKARARIELLSPYQQFETVGEAIAVAGLRIGCEPQFLSAEIGHHGPTEFGVWIWDKREPFDADTAIAMEIDKTTAQFWSALIP